MNVCQVDGCNQKVSKPDHALCLDHWKAERSGQIKHCEKCRRWHAKGSPCSGVTQSSDPDDAPDEPGYLSSTKIGKHFGLSNVKINSILYEMGWIEKYGNGWSPTDRGNAIGANVSEGKRRRGAIPYVLWPASIVNHAALLSSIENLNITESRSRQRPISTIESDFRTKFPARYFTQDGHHVRSKAEALIDNWLYMQRHVHAYERRLPIEEECYCDFYLPEGKGVYIEFWGRESDPKYRQRKAVKQAIYAKHGFQLIELGDAELERLDDVLPRMLLRFGIDTK